MAEERLINEFQKDEFLQIMELINSNENFLLSGGAGSGKTYSLVQVIKQVLTSNPTVKVACITYTNAAVKEIEERVNHKNLNVSTIHDFLWDNIKHFQKELKESLIALFNDEDVKQLKIDDLTSVPSDYYENREEPVSIQYKEYLKLRDGIISHDELLILSEYMFRKYWKLCDIVKDKYKFIFIDEYQDTHEEVVKILLEYLPRTTKKCIIGFFGDAMQAIYDTGIGDIDAYKGDGKGQVKEVKKVQNRRNPRAVITLANRLRTDGIIQEASGDITAPNMVEGTLKDGSVLFLYSDNDDISNVEHFLSENYGWDFSCANKTKELNLTHNLIADKAGFRTLMDVYDKDLILAFKKRIKDYIKDNNIKNILEIGSAIGYSAILMANATDDVTITTIEKDEERYMECLKNVKKCGLDKKINVVFQDALDVNLSEDLKYDMIFIDAAKGQYTKFFEKYKKFKLVITV